MNMGLLAAKSSIFSNEIFLAYPDPPCHTDKEVIQKRKGERFVHKPTKPLNFYCIIM